MSEAPGPIQNRGKEKEISMSYDSEGPTGIEDYKTLAICSICNQFNLCRIDWIDNKPKCSAHGGVEIFKQ